MLLTHLNGLLQSNGGNVWQTSTSYTLLQASGGIGEN